MVRPLAFLVALTLVAYPAQAAGPLVLIAKQLVQQIIVDFIEARIADTIRASFGPCKQDLAEDAIQGTRAVAGMLRGGGGGGLSSLGAAANLGSLGNVGSAASSLGAVPNVGAAISAAGTVGTVADRAASVGAVTGTAASGLGALGIAVPGLGSGSGELSQLAARMPNMQASGIDPQQMAAIQQMMTARPLDAAELDELTRILERFGKVAETIEPGSGCSADDYRRMFTRLTVMSADPRLGGMMAAMTGGMLRTMYTSFKQMEQSSVEAEQTFRQMSADDRAAYIDTMVAEWSIRPPEERRAALAMLDAGLLGVPDDMRATLRDRLAK